MNSIVKLTCVVSVAIALTLPGCGGDKGIGSATYSTPDEVFAAFKAAATKNDLKQFMSCMSAKSQNEFTFGAIMMSAFLPMNYMDDQGKAEALGKEIEGVMNKHGLSEEKMNDAEPGVEPDYEVVFAPVKDKGAFVAELFAIIEREDPDTPLKMLSTATLKDVKMDGDKASGKINVDGVDENIEFVKVDGSWLVEMSGPGGPDPGDDE